MAIASLILQRASFQLTRACYSCTTITLSKLLKINTKSTHPRHHLTKLQQRQFTSDVTSKGVPIGQISQEKSSKLLLAFTCKKCNSRVEKFISKVAYKQGLVIVKCSGCEHNHLIADNLGWFSEITSGNKNIKEILEQKGESIVCNMTDDNNIEILSSREEKK